MAPGERRRGEHDRAARRSEAPDTLVSVLVSALVSALVSDLGSVLILVRVHATPPEVAAPRGDRADK
ncbi:MAG: hypothetical protein IT373_10285 [Polyangiaceae bacterium]|nr:hypothetical protein [Polyangiaceae bacterium]